MRIVNLTKYEINLPFKGISDIQPKTISRELTLSRDVVHNYMVPLANAHQNKIIFIVSFEERFKFNDLFSVFPLLNLRSLEDLVEPTEGGEFPLGSVLVTDPNYVAPNGQISEKEFLLLASETVVDTRPGWIDPYTGDDSRKIKFYLTDQASYDVLRPRIETAIYFTTDTRRIYLGSTPYTALKSAEDLGDILKNTLIGQTGDDVTVASTKAVIDFVTSKLNSFTGGVQYSGLLNPTVPTDNPSWANPKKGYIFRISEAGELNGRKVGEGDSLIINKDVTGEPTADDYDLIPFTLDEIGDLSDLTTTNKENLVKAINEVKAEIPRWTGIKVQGSNVHANFTPIYGNEDDINNTPVVNGQFLVNNITGEQFIDVSGLRVSLSRVALVTYEELKTMVTSSKLTPGKLYLISDHRFTKEANPDLGAPKFVSSTVEPLFVRALDQETLDGTAISVLHPRDIITYDIKPGFRANGEFYGIITHRYDSDNNNTGNFDIRYHHSWVFAFRKPTLDRNLTNPEPMKLVQFKGSGKYVSMCTRQADYDALMTAPDRSRNQSMIDISEYFHPSTDICGKIMSPPIPIYGYGEALHQTIADKVTDEAKQAARTTLYTSGSYHLSVSAKNSVIDGTGDFYIVDCYNLNVKVTGTKIYNSSFLSGSYEYSVVGSCYNLQSGGCYASLVIDCRDCNITADRSLIEAASKSNITIYNSSVAKPVSNGAYYSGAIIYSTVFLSNSQVYQIHNSNVSITDSVITGYLKESVGSVTDCYLSSNQIRFNGELTKVSVEKGLGGTHIVLKPDSDFSKLNITAWHSELVDYVKVIKKNGNYYKVFYNELGQLDMKMLPSVPDNTKVVG